MSSSMVTWIDRLEAPGTLPEVTRGFLEHVAPEVGADALGLIVPLGGSSLLVAQSGGLDLDSAQALEDAWPVAEGRLVALGADLHRDHLALAARLLQTLISRRREQTADEHGRQSVAASTHELNNMLMPLYSSPSGAVLRTGQRMKLQLDCLRSLRGRECMRDLIRVPAFLDRVKGFVSWIPGGKHPVEVRCSPAAESRVLGPGVDLLPFLVDAGYAMRSLGSPLLLSADVEDGDLVFDVETEAEGIEALVAHLNLTAPTGSQAEFTTEGAVSRIRIRAQTKPLVLVLTGQVPPTPSLTQTLVDLGVETVCCDSTEELLEKVREDPVRCLVVATHGDPEALSLKRSLLMLDAHLGLHAFFTVGGPAAPGSDVRGQVDLGSLLAGSLVS